ncbi:MAG: glycerophosphoryl diester phosphodiesterase GlpQ [Idiomarinaceae bacterium HL-53]|nr:MAG: glycerophosphoryl diester phosphodiesterase GlpQ [Idiomarinaceae bacterium HL-53]CUS48195.1 glycerophosphoryl diester phosphodiesterase [Idiomarinaceae bacterium HL-53]
MLVIAHRGASALAPENTLAAFEKALECKADAIEFDVLEVDNEVYVFHDRYLDRLTAQPGRFTDLTKTQIARLSVFGQHPIPTLKEALATIAGRCTINIELKGYVATKTLIEHIELALSQYHFVESQIIVSSFNHHWLQTLKASRPETQIGALTASCMLDYAAYGSALNAWSVHIDINFVTEEFVKDAHARGMKVFVYTVDNAQDIQWLTELGVDGIFTNHPLYARNILEELPMSEQSLHARFIP